MLSWPEKRAGGTVVKFPILEASKAPEKFDQMTGRRNENIEVTVLLRP